MDDEIVFILALGVENSSTYLMRRINNLKQSICDSIWEVSDFARHFKCWQCLKRRDFGPADMAFLAYSLDR